SEYLTLVIAITTTTENNSNNSVIRADWLMKTSSTAGIAQHLTMYGKNKQSNFADLEWLVLLFDGQNGSVSDAFPLNG
ncbi:hypothetical protein QP468_23405, partial [Proteus mirabilis]|nr:hypothetical protein [Proteus mirabilis]